MLTSIHTGLRNQELRLLKWRKVDLLDATIYCGRQVRGAGDAHGAQGEHYTGAIPHTGRVNGHRVYKLKA